MFQYCTDPSGQEIRYFRALQGHPGRNPIDLSLQDNVLIPNNFFEYIYHIRCAINLHSTNSGIDTGRTQFEQRQTVFFTALNLLNKEHKDPCEIDLNTPRLAWYKQKVEKTSRHGVSGSIYKLLNRKDSSSIKQDRTQSSFTTHSQLIVSKSCQDGNWRSHLREVKASPRPPKKSSLKDDWMKEIGFRSCWK